MRACAEQSVRGEQQQRRLHEERRAEEERREMWQQKLLRDLAVSAREPADWLNKLLVLLWPNVLHPRTLAATQAAMQSIMDRDVPPHVQSVEILEMDFGDAAPQVGPLGLFWSTRQPHKTHSTARNGGAAAAAGLTADGQSSAGVAGGGGGVVGGEGEGGTEGAREQREQHESERESEHTQAEEGEEEEQGLNVDVRWGSSGLSVVLAVHFASDAPFPSSSSHSLLPASSSLSSSQHGTPHSLASSSSVAPGGFKIQLAISNVAVAGTVRVVPVCSGGALLWSFVRPPAVSFSLALHHHTNADAALFLIAGFDEWLTRVLSSYIAAHAVDPVKELLPLTLPPPSLSPAPPLLLPAPLPSVVGGYLSLSLLSASNLVRPSNSPPNAPPPASATSATAPAPVAEAGAAGEETRGAVVGACVVEVQCGEIRRASLPSVTSGRNPKWSSSPAAAAAAAGGDAGEGSAAGGGAVAGAVAGGEEGAMLLWGNGPRFSLTLRVCELSGKVAAAAAAVAADGAAAVAAAGGGDGGGGSAGVASCVVLGTAQLHVAYTGVDGSTGDATPYAVLWGMGPHRLPVVRRVPLSPSSLRPVTISLALDYPSTLGSIRIRLSPPSWLPAPSPTPSLPFTPPPLFPPPHLVPSLLASSSSPPAIPPAPPSFTGRSIRVTVVEGRHVWESRDGRATGVGMGGKGAGGGVPGIVVEVEYGKQRVRTRAIPDANPVWGDALQLREVAGAAPLLHVRCLAFSSLAPWSPIALGHASLFLQPAALQGDAGLWLPMGGAGGSGDVHLMLALEPPHAQGLEPGATAEAAAGGGGGGEGIAVDGAAGVDGSTGTGKRPSSVLRVSPLPFLSLHPGHPSSVHPYRPSSSPPHSPPPFQNPSLPPPPPSGPVAQGPCGVALSRKDRAVSSRRLQVTVVGVRGLASHPAVVAAKGKAPDTYATVRYGATKRRTKVVHRSLAPEWQALFDLPDTGEDLEVTVKEPHGLALSLSTALPLGSCRVDYSGLRPGSSHEFWLPLAARVSQSVIPPSLPQSGIHLLVHFVSSTLIAVLISLAKWPEKVLADRDLLLSRVQELDHVLAAVLGPAAVQALGSGRGRVAGGVAE
ncbi:unnamed protein product [Closterium sp. Naga37s-1]|nr:unnamed protein product [Closterium sp. Naga37s-1]